MAPSPESVVNYGLYTASDADEMTGLLGEVFARRDPPAVAAGLTLSEFEAFVRLFCPTAEADGLTPSILLIQLPENVEDGIELRAQLIDPIRQR
jgi:hypothetical protein